MHESRVYHTVDDKRLRYQFIYGSQVSLRRPKKKSQNKTNWGPRTEPWAKEKFEKKWLERKWVISNQWPSVPPDLEKFIREGSSGYRRMSSSHFQSSLLWNNFSDLQRGLLLIWHLVSKIKWNLRPGDFTGTQKNLFWSYLAEISLCFKLFPQKNQVFPLF